MMGLGLDHALLCVTCFMLNMLCDCVNNIHGRCIWNTRARKHNLRGSKSKINMIVQELICISVWHYAPLRKKG